MDAIIDSTCQAWLILGVSSLPMQFVLLQVEAALDARAGRAEAYCPSIDQTGTFRCFSPGLVGWVKNLVSE